MCGSHGRVDVKVAAFIDFEILMHLCLIVIAGNIESGLHTFEGRYVLWQL
jgi:hypothetical protein